MGEDGKPTKESLDIVFNVISHTAGHDGRIEGAYVESNEFEVMNDYAQSLMAENENRGREKYNIMSNNCSTFAEEVLKQDESIRKSHQQVCSIYQIQLLRNGKRSLRP